MPIETGRGDLIRADVDALVNPVNTEGVMGKGLALQFKRAFPEIEAPYRAACASGELMPGRVQVLRRAGRPRYVVNFPTKREWRRPSTIEYVREGLVDLVVRVREHGVESIAVPPLGCGLGGLAWSMVRPLIIAAFEGLPELRVVLFEPEGAPPKAPGRRARG